VKSHDFKVAMFVIFNKVSDYSFLSNFATAVTISTLGWSHVGLCVMKVTSVLFPYTTNNSSETGCDNQAFDFALHTSVQNCYHSLSSRNYHLIFSEINSTRKWTSHVYDVCSSLHRF
jgi:hypothetical protein